MKPTDEAPDWTGQTFADRIHACRVMLALHGSLPPSWSEEIERRQVRRGFVPTDAVVVPPYDERGDRG